MSLGSALERALAGSLALAPVLALGTPSMLTPRSQTSKAKTSTLRRSASRLEGRIMAPAAGCKLSTPRLAVSDELRVKSGGVCARAKPRTRSKHHS